MSVDILNIFELSPPYYIDPSAIGTLDLYSYGYLTKNGSLDLSASGHLVKTGSLDLYAYGHGASHAGLNLSATGRIPYIESGLDLSATGFSYTVTSGLDLYAYVSNVAEEDGSINLFCKVLEGSQLMCYCQGPGNPEINSINMFSSGSIGVNGNLTLVCPSSRDNKSGSISMYCRGW